MKNDSWYRIDNADEIDSPALLIYRDRVEQNINLLIHSIDDVTRLRPHIKTHKSGEISHMLMDHGIHKFKCATIAEAEVLATEGATDILLAYQPVGPKAKRFLQLMRRFPDADLKCLVDNYSTAHSLALLAHDAGLTASIFIDINVGMNRTGIDPSEVVELWTQLKQFPSLQLRGLHAYDGHIRDQDMTVRETRCNAAFKRVSDVATEIESLEKNPITIVAGGSPTYPIHARRKHVECSPGTFIYWDKGYGTILPEQPYLHSALVLTRVISKPAEGLVCIDLGHKSIASENPLSQRVSFLNAPDLEPVGHSEEHMVLKTNGTELNVGDVLYGVPFHVCPTTALYERAHVVVGKAVTDTWITLSRNRKITV